jgi:hypothetical protein
MERRTVKFCEGASTLLLTADASLDDAGWKPEHDAVLSALLAGLAALGGLPLDASPDDSTAVSWESLRSLQRELSASGIRASYGRGHRSCLPGLGNSCKRCLLKFLDDRLRRWLLEAYLEDEVSSSQRSTPASKQRSLHREAAGSPVPLPSTTQPEASIFGWPAHSPSKSLSAKRYEALLAEARTPEHSPAGSLAGRARSQSERLAAVADDRDFLSAEQQATTNALALLKQASQRAAAAEPPRRRRPRRRGVWRRCGPAATAGAAAQRALRLHPAASPAAASWCRGQSPPQPPQRAWRRARRGRLLRPGVRRGVLRCAAPRLRQGRQLTARAHPAAAQAAARRAGSRQAAAAAARRRRRLEAQAVREGDEKKEGRAAPCAAPRTDAFEPSARSRSGSLARWPLATRAFTRAATASSVAG